MVSANNPLFTIESEPEIVNKGFLNMRKSNSDINNNSSNEELNPAFIQNAKLECKQDELDIMNLQNEKSKI